MFHYSKARFSSSVPNPNGGNSTKRVLQCSIDSWRFHEPSWVMTTELQLPKFHGRFSDGSEVLDALAELFDGLVFYRDEEYYHLSEWVILVSEALDPKFVDYSPVGVKWYYPRYALYSPFPFTDLSRPAGFFDCTSCTASSSYDTVCNTGTCNNETGLCDCLYNATGYYCEKEPFGNGVCDDFLNHNRFYDYQFWFDGGDCCAPTCSLPHCGQGRLDTLFGVDLSEANLTYMSANTSASDWIGYQKCRDEEMITFLMELIPESNATQVCVPPFTVQCGVPGVDEYVQLV